MSASQAQLEPYRAHDQPESFESVELHHSSISSDALKSGEPILSCRWLWCRHVFTTVDELEGHLIIEHINPARPVKRRDLRLLRRVEEGVGESLGLEGIMAADQANTGQISHPQSSPTPSSRHRRAHSRSSSAPYNSPAMTPSHVSKSQPVAGPSSARQPLSPVISHSSDISVEEEDDDRQFQGLTRLSSPSGTPPIKSIPSSPEFRVQVNDALYAQTQTKHSRKSSNASHQQSSISRIMAEQDRENVGGHSDNSDDAVVESQLTNDIELSFASVTGGDDLAEDDVRNKTSNLFPNLEDNWALQTQQQLHRTADASTAPATEALLALQSDAISSSSFAHAPGVQAIDVEPHAAVEELPLYRHDIPLIDTQEIWDGGFMDLQTQAPYFTQSIDSMETQ